MILTITANPAVDRVYFVEEFEIGKVYRPLEMTVTAGGKGLNVAKVVKTLGEDVTVMGFAGGYNGDIIVKYVSELGIIESFTRIKGETRTCVNISARNGKSGEILEPGPEITQNDIERIIELYKNSLEKINIVAISGSIPPGVPSDFYAQLVNIARQYGKKVIIDASGTVFRKTVNSRPFMVKPNKYELSMYLSKSLNRIDSIKEGVKHLYDIGIELPVVSLGKDGAITYYESEFYKFTTPNVPVVNAVGSGDSFIAGTAFALSRGDSYLDALKMGMACGTANTQYAQTGTVSVEWVDNFYKDISVEKC